MSPYCMYQVDSCPAFGRSGNTSIRTGDGLVEGARSSSKPESHNLDINICFLQRAFCRCRAGVSASDGVAALVVRLRL